MGPGELEGRTRGLMCFLSVEKLRTANAITKSFGARLKTRLLRPARKSTRSIRTSDKHNFLKAANTVVMISQMGVG